ncbi:Uncharacterized protein BM_BM10126 [Brugia malayi]|uniref:Bm10126 n=1 Tax=Brugia malayi TaxID=6279 RepID=A0A0K0IM57_BRUMA|nr:Uncharacterized protein BM_BM10126 [Brugia malayi]CDP96990.1 Bm10126 [Brugia malayi]VIO85795.1 Uncharacterized protein BM_BM10126 [Brugia malayi]
MKLANGSERLEMHIFNGERKDVEGATGQPVSVPIVHYDYEPRSRCRPSERMEYILLQRPQQLFDSETTSPPKNDAKEISQSMFIGNEGPSLIVKATVCLIALIIMVICLCFLFA